MNGETDKTVPMRRKTDEELERTSVATDQRTSYEGSVFEQNDVITNACSLLLTEVLTTKNTHEDERTKEQLQAENGMYGDKTRNMYFIT